MENASKALIMAGSVLISVLVITALVFMFDQLKGNAQTDTDIDEIKKMVNYNKRFEQFNKSEIYGSDLLSLANLKKDYYENFCEYDGYTDVNIKVNIRSASSDRYFKTGSNILIEKIFLDKEDIEKDIKFYEKDRTVRGKTVKYYSLISNREIAIIFYGYDYFSSSDSDYDVGEKLKNSSATRELMSDIEKYKNLKNDYTTFKSKRFQCDNLTYDNGNGRITSMKFKEI